MHSYEERMKAVRLFIKYELSVADTIRELGYPTRNTLIRWYNEYLEKGDLHEKFQKKPGSRRRRKEKLLTTILSTDVASDGQSGNWVIRLERR